MISTFPALGRVRFASPAAYTGSDTTASPRRTAVLRMFMRFNSSSYSSIVLCGSSCAPRRFPPEFSRHAIGPGAAPLHPQRVLGRLQSSYRTVPPFSRPPFAPLPPGHHPLLLDAGVDIVKDPPSQVFSTFLR